MAQFHLNTESNMLETPEDGILIVTDETPQIAIPDGVKGGNTITRSWGDETSPKVLIAKESQMPLRLALKN